MPQQKQSHLTDPVKNFLKMKIAQAGYSPKYLGSEMSMCKDFNLSRPTLHRAIEELLNEGWCLHLPGKRGVYSNPSQYLPGLRNIAIMGSDCQSNTFINHSALIAFLNEFDDMRTFIDFIQLSSEDIQGRVKELSNLQLAGIFFSINNLNTKQEQDNFSQLVKAIIRRQIPVVCFLYYAYDSLGIPQENIVLLDQLQLIQSRMDFAHRKGFQDVALITPRKECLKLYRKLDENFLAEKHFISSREDIPIKLPLMLKNNPPDLIIADGGPRWYHQLVETLRHIPGTLPDFLLYPLIHEYEDDSVLKRMRIHFIDDRKTLRTAGKLAAEKLKEQMSRNCKKELSHAQVTHAIGPQTSP